MDGRFTTGKRGGLRRIMATTLSLFLLLSLPFRAECHSDVPPDAHLATSFPGQQSEAGLDERLGEKIPLDLTFRDEAGREVLLSRLVTGPTIILPVYYGCTNICNFLQQGMASVLPSLKGRPGRDFRVISVSFDETETPELAARRKKMYLSTLNPDFPEEGWLFLTGDASSIRRLTDAAGFRFVRRGHDFVHPVVSIVVTGDGTIVRYLYGTNFLPKDVTLALLEAREGRVGSSIRTFMEYCFTFDPKGKTYVFNLMRVSATVVILMAGAFLAFLMLTGRKRSHPAGRDEGEGR